MGICQSICQALSSVCMKIPRVPPFIRCFELRTGAFLIAVINTIFFLLGVINFSGAIKEINESKDYQTRKHKELVLSGTSTMFSTCLTAFIANFLLLFALCKSNRQWIYIYLWVMLGVIVTLIVMGFGQMYGSVEEGVFVLVVSAISSFFWWWIQTVYQTLEPRTENPVHV